MGVYDVKAIALRPATGEVVAGPRVERIDTDTNVLFTGCTREWDVEDAYEAFWNRINDSWEVNFPVGGDKVKVLTVTRVKEATQEWWVKSMRHRPDQGSGTFRRRSRPE